MDPLAYRKADPTMAAEWSACLWSTVLVRYMVSTATACTSDTLLVIFAVITREQNHKALAYLPSSMSSILHTADFRTAHLEIFFQVFTSDNQLAAVVEFNNERYTNHVPPLYADKAALPYVRKVRQYLS